jgi:hypothetical protein
MGRAFAEHWKGVVAGLLVLNVGFWLLQVLVPPVYIAKVPPIASEGRLIPVMESQATAVVENPLSLPASPGVWRPDVVFPVLILLASGATAARVGRRVVAWRGAVVGVLGTVEFWVIQGGTHVSEAVLASIALGAATYAGGGLVKLLVWARSRAA